MVADGAFSHKRDYVTVLREILNLDGHPNCITGSKVMAILLNRWALPIGGASAVKSVRLQPNNYRVTCFTGAPQYFLCTRSHQNWLRIYLSARECKGICT
jgi:hypothetical protein